MKTFKYRIYPKKRQVTLLNQAVEDSRIIYNELLSMKKDIWQDKQKNLTQFDAQLIITGIRKEKEMKTATVILRFAKDRLFYSYNHFFRKRNKFPRFKGKGFYSSIGLYTGQYELKGNKITIPKIGKIHIVKHRKWKGIPKRIIIKKSATDKWYLCICCEGKFSKKLPKTKKEVGIDLGLETFAVLSDGSTIERERLRKSRTILLKHNKSYQNKGKVPLKEKGPRRLFQECMNELHLREIILYTSVQKKL